MWIKCMPCVKNISGTHLLCQIRRCGAKIERSLKNSQKLFPVFCVSPIHLLHSISSWTHPSQKTKYMILSGLRYSHLILKLAVKRLLHVPFIYVASVSSVFPSVCSAAKYDASTRGLHWYIREGQRSNIDYCLEKKSGLVLCLSFVLNVPFTRMQKNSRRQHNWH